ncbi:MULTISPECIES: single-stranded DNA-binding protein [Agathobaculum]|uniref:single-stranded DNA-binding protein n=1 Tax=Agathobaculum TaxID=2048137 RepID=UPI003F8E669F
MSNAISINNTVLMGRLTRDPELRYVNGDIPMCFFKLAVARQTSGEEKTDFIPCVAWREKAKFVSQWFSKGTLAVVIGQVTSRIWADDQGGNHIAFEVLCDQIQFGETRRQRVERESADKQEDAARGSVQIMALDADTGMLLSGAAYDLYHADGTPVRRNISGTDSGAHIVGLPAGEYIITEIAAPAHYSPAARSVTASVRPGEDCVISILHTAQAAPPAAEPAPAAVYSIPEGVPDDDTGSPI